MSLPHPDLAIIYNHRDIVCYKLPDISILSVETHILELRVLWSFQHPSFSDLSENSGGYFFVSKPVRPRLESSLKFRGREEVVAGRDQGGGCL
jgi:hypothetical protein